MSLKLDLLVVLLLVVPFTLPAQENKYPKKVHHAARLTDGPPHIDGRLDEPMWLNANRGSDFIQHEPSEGKAPSQKTEFAIVFDENDLYVGIWAYDTHPDSISRRLTRRDQVDGDIVGVEIDSYHDHRTSFGFWVSASGVKMDRIATDDGRTEDDTWDPIWYVQSAITQEGWTAEMRIPLSQLRFSEDNDSGWGFNVLRSVFRVEETSLWQPVPRNASGMVSYYGDLIGVSGIKPRKQADITPYVVGSVVTDRVIEGNPYAKKGTGFQYNAGLDSKIGITNNVTLDLTINPDFGQVEADPSEVNLTAYETFFQEKRPFFIEGRSILSMSLMFGDGDLADENMFYTRRVGRRPQGSPTIEEGEYIHQPEFTTILAAAKITGKTEKGLSFGLMESITQNEVAEMDLDGEKRYETVEPLTNYLVGSIHKDYNDGNTVISGILTATNRKLEDPLTDQIHRSAYTGGLTFQQFFKNKSYMLLVKTYTSDVNGTAQAIARTQQSSTHYYQRPDRRNYLLDTTRTALIGNGGSIFFGKIGNSDFQWGGFMNWKTPGINLNDAGFIQSADQFMPIFWAGYQVNEPFWIIRSSNVNTNHWTVFDFAGQYQGYGGNINGSLTFRNLWSMSAGLNWETETIETGMLRGGPAFINPAGLYPWINLRTDTRKKLSVRVYESVNLYDEGHGYYFNTEVEITYKPIDALSLSLSPNYMKNICNMQYIGKASFGDTPRYIFGLIDQHVVGLSMRVNLTLTPNFTIQYWGQPFLASGRYADLKYVTDGMADEYANRYASFTDDQIEYDPSKSQCRVDENRDGTIDYTVDHPDFNFKEFKSNLVLRWEYRPGSVLFLVWSQDRSGSDPFGDFSFRRDVSDLYDITPRNVFLIKFSYRIGR